MATSSYADLQEQISAYLKGRDDLTDRIRDFIKLAERKIHRKLRVEEMVETNTLTFTSATTAVPALFLEMRLAELQSNPTVQLSKINARDASAMYADGTAGRPCYYRIVGETMQLYPAPDQNYSVNIEYWARPFYLADWDNDGDPPILEDHFDIYLYGALCEAAPYLYDDARIPTWRQMFLDAIEEANAQADRSLTSGDGVMPAYGSIA